MRLDEEWGQEGRVSCGHWIARKESTWNGGTCKKSRGFYLVQKGVAVESE